MIVFMYSEEFCQLVSQDVKEFRKFPERGALTDPKTYCIINVLINVNYIN